MMSQKIFSILLVVIMAVAMLPIPSFAHTNTMLTIEELREQNGAITIEAYNIGRGFLLEPTLFTKEGKSTGDITVDVLTNKNIDYTGSTSYFSGLAFDDSIEAIYPDYLQSYSLEFDTTGDGNGYLDEFDYSWYSGWCYTINDWWASWGADSSYPGGILMDYNTGEEVVLGDVIRWHFTVYGYGADCGFPGNMMAEFSGGNLFTQADKTDLIFLLAAINDYYGNLDADTVYETALAVAGDPLATATQIANQETILQSYIENTFFQYPIQTEITECNEKTVSFAFSEEGVSITLIFADYENKCFQRIKPVPVVTKKTNGENKMTIPVPDDITLSAGDKVMLWEDFATCMPLCEAYVVGNAQLGANSY